MSGNRNAERTAIAEQLIDIASPCGCGHHWCEDCWEQCVQCGDLYRIHIAGKPALPHTCDPEIVDPPEPVDPDYEEWAVHDYEPDWERFIYEYDYSSDDY